MKTTKLTLTLLATLLVSLSSISPITYAQPNDGNGASFSVFGSPFGFEKGHNLKRLAKHLDLSAEQRQQMKVIKEQSKLTNMAIHQELKAFKAEVKPLIMAETFDESAFTALQSQYQSAFAQMALQKAKTRHQIFQLLTDEQKEKMQAMRARRAERFQ